MLQSELYGHQARLPDRVDHAGHNLWVVDSHVLLEEEASEVVCAEGVASQSPGLLVYARYRSRHPLKNQKTNYRRRTDPSRIRLRGRTVRYLHESRALRSRP